MTQRNAPAELASGKHPVTGQCDEVFASYRSTESGHRGVHVVISFRFFHIKVMEGTEEIL